MSRGNCDQGKAEIRRFGLSMGFTENELAQIYDSRAVQVLRDHE